MDDIIENIIERDPRHNFVLTGEDGRRGGKVTAAESPMKAIASYMRARKYCDAMCPFYDSCPMLPLSMDSPVVKEKNTKYGVIKTTKYLCKMRDAPVAIKRRIENMFLNGEDGLLNEIRGALFITSTTLGNDNKERMQYADTLMKFHRSVYGEKGTQINSQEPLEITVRQLHTPGGGAQEVRISEKGRCSPESKARLEAEALKIIEKREHPIPEAEEPEDPESLFSSPIMVDLVKRPKHDKSGN